MFFFPTGYQRGERSLGQHEVHGHQVHERHAGAWLHSWCRGRGHANPGRQLHEPAEHVGVALHRPVPQPGPDLGEELVPHRRSSGGKFSMIL